MMTKNHLVLYMLLAAVCTACISSKMQRLPAYDFAATMQGPETPKVFYAEQVAVTSLPAAAPFATISTYSTSIVGREALASSALKKAKEVRADFLLVTDAESFTTGSTYQHIGYGSGFSQNTYGQSIGVVAFRVCPSQLGFTRNSAQMVTSISNESLRACGLQEGDTLVSIEGVPVSSELNSPHFQVMLSVQPEDEFDIVWIRPGIGRMEGKATALQNPPKHLEIPDSLEVRKAEKKRKNAKKKNRGSPPS